MRNRYGPATVTLLYAAFAAVWIVASGSVLHIVSEDPVTQGRIEIAKGLAFVALSAGMLFLLLRKWPAGAVQPGNAGESMGWRLALALTVVALSVPLIGFAVFVLQAQQDEEEALSELRVIADFKADQIERWLAERRGDVSALAESRGFVERVEAMERDGDPRQRDLVNDRLATLRRTFAYDGVVLLNAHGETLLSAGEHEPVSREEGAALIRSAAAVSGVQMSDLHPDAAGHFHLHLIATLPGTDAPGPVGGIVVHLSADQFLFPLVQSWPTASRSGESLLVRGEGDSVRYLSRLKHRDNTALSVLLPMDSAQLPGAAAVRAKTPGVRRGVNYRGVPVLSAWRRIAGTDWYLLANLDRDEARDSSRTTALWVSAVALVAAAMVAIAMLMLVRQQRMTQQLDLRVQSDSLLRQFYEMPFVGMAITSPTTKRWMKFNDRLCSMFGYTRDELATKTWTEITHPEDVAKDVVEFERVMAGEIDGYIMDKRFLRKNGGLLHAMIDVKCVRKADGSVDYFVATIEDISQRKVAEAKILKLSRLYLTLSRCSTAVAHCTNADVLLTEICRAAVESSGMALAWVGMLDPQTRLVHAAASFGDDAGYLRDIHISVDGEDPLGRGPTGTAIREGEPYWCQDFRNDPRTAPWHERAEQAGWRASAALPLRRGGEVVGALTLYTREEFAFDEETRGLLMEMATDIGFGLDNFDREAARTRAETQLRESEERYRLLIESSQDAILLTQPDGRILAVNPAACRIFGASEDELLKEGRAGVVDPADTRLAPALEERMRTGRFSGELTMRRHNGERFPAEISTAIFIDRHGEQRSSMIIRDITERKAAEEQLAHLVHHDALTGLPNRVLLTDRLDVALAQAQRSGKQLALLFMDLDRFKNVNDSLGHDSGDRLLREAAHRLKANVRTADTVSRQGGDEFVVVLPEIDGVQDAARVAQKLIAAIARPFRLGDSDVVLTASIGIACFPENGRDAESLLRNADAAMYAAKDMGRDRYQFYSKDMNARTHERLLLETDLRRAIERDQLFLVYQPQLDLGSAVVVGLEALLRWRHPVRGVVPPAQFIAIAEDSGLITVIGTWVLEGACRQQAAWLAQGLAVGTIAVNVSAHQFHQPDFVDTVAAALSRSRLPPKHLELEVTEGVVMRGVDEVLRKLDTLHRLGVKLAIDDFGTGYSSLSYLKQFPVWRLKIDQSFTRGLPADLESGAIAQAIISLGHSLGLNVLAEGIETEEQEEHLRAMRCNTGQGYLYAKPMPADACTQYLRQRARPPDAAAEPGIRGE